MTPADTSLGKRARTAFVAALLLPYLILQSLATGVMPVLGDDGLSFAICSGDDTYLASFSPESDGEPDHAQAECPWAITDMPTALAGLPGLAAPTDVYQPLDAKRLWTTRRVATLRPVPPARAPPART